MRQDLLRCLFLCLFVSVAVAPALADTPVGRIRVQLNDQNGQPQQIRVRIERFGEFNDTTAQELPEGRYVTLSNKGQDAWTDVTPDPGPGQYNPQGHHGERGRQPVATRLLPHRRQHRKR